MLQSQYVNPIELEEIELSPDNLTSLLRSVQISNDKKSISKFKHIEYREILSSGSDFVLTTDRNLIFQLDFEQPLNYKGAFESKWWLISENCSSSGNYDGPFPDLSFAARTFQLSYFIKLLDDYFERLVVSKKSIDNGLNYHFRAHSASPNIKLSGSLLFDMNNQLKEIQLFLQFNPLGSSIAIDNLQLVNSYTEDQTIVRQQAMTSYIGPNNYKITQFQDFQFSNLIPEKNQLQLPINSRKPLKPHCYEP